MEQVSCIQLLIKTCHLILMTQGELLIEKNVDHAGKENCHQHGH
jgi:hypothetical protein